MKFLLLFSLILLPFSGWNQSLVYGVDSQNSNLYSIDTTTFIETNIALTSSTGTVDGCTGLSSDPCGATYIVYKVNGSRYLGTINFNTGFITEIGLLADNVSNIAYDFINAVMYGVTGDGATTPETLYSINLTTASMTFLATLGNGDDGEAISFNSADGLLYHWSGWEIPNVIMETINLTSFVITPVAFSGDTVNNVGAAVYVGGKFLVSDIYDESLHWVTTSGAVTNIATNAFEIKGLAFETAPVPVVSLSANSGSVICSGSPVVVTASSNYPGGAFEWFDGAGVSTGITTTSFSTSTAGTFSCQLTDVCGTIASSSITITAGSNPVVQLLPTGPLGFCPGDSVLLSSNTSGTTNQWYLNGSLLSGASNDSVYATDEGIYNMVLTNSDGCSDSAANGVIVNLNSSPSVILSPSGGAMICPGDSVELTVSSGGGAIQWYLNGNIISNANANSYYASTAGFYNVIKTNSSGCTDSSATPLIVAESNVPNVILTPSPSVNFCSPGTVNISVNTGGGTIQWYQDGAVIPGETSSSYTVSNEGVYNVLKTNMNGCSDSASVGTSAIDTCLLSVDEINLDQNIAIYPNPAVNNVTINIPENTIGKVQSIAIISFDGKIVLQLGAESILTSNVEIGLETLSSGIYIVHIKTEHHKVFKELVIE